MAAVGFAIVGLGTLAQTAILPAFRGMEEARLVALVSRDGKRLDALYRSAESGVTQTVELHCGAGN